MARWVIAAAWAYAAAAVLAAAAMWLWGDRWWPGTALLFGPRWLLLLPLAILLPALLLVRPRRRLRDALLPLALAVLVVLGPFMGLRLGWRGLLAPGDGPTLRVATFNAGGAVGPVVALLPVLQDADVDVATVQECDSEVPRLLEDHPLWHMHRVYGLCVLSRHPIVSAEPARWDELDAVAQRGMGQSGTAVEYRLRAPSGELRLVNLHLETPRKGLERLRYDMESSPVAGNTLIRTVGSRRVFEWTGPDRHGLVVAGDFNMPVESTIYRAGWSTLRNAYTDAGWGFGLTKDNGWIRVRIDHILTGGGWRARRAWLGPDVGSDHRPVLAELVDVRGGRP